MSQQYAKIRPAHVSVLTACMLALAGCGGGTADPTPVVPPSNSTTSAVPPTTTVDPVAAAAAAAAAAEAASAAAAAEAQAAATAQAVAAATAAAQAAAVQASAAATKSIADAAAAASYATAAAKAATDAATAKASALATTVLATANTAATAAATAAAAAATASTNAQAASAATDADKAAADAAVIAASADPTSKATATAAALTAASNASAAKASAAAAAKSASDASAASVAAKAAATKLAAPVVVVAPPPASTIAPLVSVDACLPSGKGKDYQVGDQPGQLASLEAVPWDSLAAGDTVRIFHRSTPYRGKFMISASGTATAPVRICGVKSTGGLRPIIDGKNAVTRIGMAYGDSAGTSYLHQARSVIVVKTRLGQDWTAYPTYIQIDGLEVRGAMPANTFTDTAGVVRNYAAFGACIWLQRGQNITIADNVINDCNQGLYSKSAEDGDFALTKNIRVAGNYIYNNGIVGDEHMHNAYMASINIVYEFNRFGAPRVGSLGNAIKDRSAGTVIRYNHLEEGAHSLDLVEAEDFPVLCKTLPSYRTTFVYGNRIIKNGDTGSVIHYGGDHYGATPSDMWGESGFRQGTLYFYNNSLHITSTNTRGNAMPKLFQLSTTLERAEVWNNVFTFASNIAYPSMRATQEVNTTYWTTGGILNLGKNWINSNWADSDPWHPVPGQLLGQANLITGTVAPIDTTTLVPLASTTVVDTGTAAPSASVATAISGHPVTYQLNTLFKPQVRTTTGAGPDMGAIER